MSPRVCRLGRCIFAALAAWSLTACGDTLPPTGQVLLYFDTDAPVPPEPGATLGPEDPPPLFDTVHVDVFEPSQATPCARCSRDFSLDRSLFRDGRASIGLPTRPHEPGYRARLRLFDSRATLGGGVPEALPDGTPATSVVEVVLSLPEVEAEGIVEANILLPTDAVGQPQGTLDAPLEPYHGKPGASRVGTWPGAARIPCAGTPKPGEVCVPGGAYWWSNPNAVDSDGTPSRGRLLTVIGPFFIDSIEVTVADYRAFPAHGIFLPLLWSTQTSGTNELDWCTFTTTPDARDGFPVVCVTYEGARAFCGWKGGKIPTEAQFEYVAGGLESRLFVWGSDLPTCPDAVLARAASAGGACVPPGSQGFAEVTGDAAVPARRDRLELPTGVVYDLVGNAAEWVLDSWNRSNEPCWSAPGVHVNPLCSTPSPTDGMLGMLRGGSYETPEPGSALAAYRVTLPRDGNSPILGFRCVRPASP